MYNATKNIYDYLKSTTELKVFTDESDKQSQCWLQFGIDNGGSYKIKFVSTDDDNDVAVRVFALINVKDDDKKAKILPALNELNKKYRFVKFVCDDDGDVNVEYDFLVNSIRPEESAKEIISRIVSIIDEAYPVLMRALWS